VRNSVHATLVVGDSIKQVTALDSMQSDIEVYEFGGTVRLFAVVLRARGRCVLDFQVLIMILLYLLIFEYAKIHKVFRRDTAGRSKTVGTCG
jgi:hypothetical protein